MGNEEPHATTFDVAARGGVRRRRPARLFLHECEDDTLARFAAEAESRRRRSQQLDLAADDAQAPLQDGFRRPELDVPEAGLSGRVDEHGLAAVLTIHE